MTRFFEVPIEVVLRVEIHDEAILDRALEPSTQAALREQKALLDGETFQTASDVAAELASVSLIGSEPELYLIDGWDDLKEGAATFKVNQTSISFKDALEVAK